MIDINDSNFEMAGNYISFYRFKNKIVFWANDNGVPKGYKKITLKEVLENEDKVTDSMTKMFLEDIKEIMIKEENIW